MQSNKNSFLIDASGPLGLLHNCFSYNAVGVSPAVSYHAANNAVVVTNNFAEVSRGGVCPFVSHFLTSWQYETDSPYCHDFDVTSCAADSIPAYWTSTPTGTPSQLAKTTSPSKMPTNVLHTISPSGQPITTRPTRSELVANGVTGGPTVAARSQSTPEPSRESNIFPSIQVASAAEKCAGLSGLLPLSLVAFYLCWYIR